MHKSQPFACQAYAERKYFFNMYILPELAYSNSNPIYILELATLATIWAACASSLISHFERSN